MRKLLLTSLPLFLLVFLTSCVNSGDQALRIAQAQAISQEPPGDYYIGRRYYNPNYKFWGYVRRPGQPWRTAQLVMLNEKQKLAPDREINQFGVDNNCEYHLFGKFTGESVYEPASNRFYPEFLLTNYELVNRSPPSIFPTNTHQSSTVITQPDY